MTDHGGPVYGFDLQLVVGDVILMLDLIVASILSGLKVFDQIYPQVCPSLGALYLFSASDRKLSFETEWNI